MIKETPILYRPEMVSAIMCGFKNMTRRTKGLENISSRATMIVPCNDYKGGDWVAKFKYDLPEERYEITNIIKCPFGKVGDLFWVREEHKVWRKEKYWYCEYKDGAENGYYYKKLSLNTLNRLTKRKTLGKWQRARFLPKDLCRLWLEITDIKVERLKEISEADAKAEGVEPHLIIPGYFKKYGNKEEWCTSAYSSFSYLWESINGEGSFNANPWVWVVKFKVVIQN